MDGHGSVYLELFETKPCCIRVCPIILTCYGTPFCSPKMSKISQDFPCLAKCCLAFFGGGCQIPRLGCFLLVGCCLSCLVFFLPFLGAAKSLAWVFLARRVLTKWMVMGSVYLELFSNKALLHPCVPYYPLGAMEHHFVVPNVQILSRFSLSSQVLPAFFGGDAKSLAWVFLARRVLPFVFFFFFLPFLGGDAKSLAWVFLARRVLPFVLGFFCCLFWGRCQSKWMVMGSVICVSCCFLY